MDHVSVLGRIGVIVYVLGRLGVDLFQTHSVLAHIDCLFTTHSAYALLVRTVVTVVVALHHFGTAYSTCGVFRNIA